MSIPNLGQEGGIFRCGETGLIYLVEDGKKRQFPNASVYASWGSPPYQDVNCQLLNQIPDGLAIPTLYPGSILRCAKTGAIYQICQNGMKCHYPNMRIYRSYGSPKYQHTSCLLLNLLPNGPDIQLKPVTPTPAPAPVPPITAPIPMAIPRPENTIPRPQATVALPPPTPASAPILTYTSGLPPPQVPSSPGDKQAFLFSDPNYQGQVLILNGPTIAPNLDLLGFLDNQPGSIKVGSGLNVRLYADQNMQTLVEEIQGPASIPNRVDGNPVSGIQLLNKTQTGIRQLIEMPSNNNVYWILFAILIIIVLTFLFFKTR